MSAPTLGHVAGRIRDSDIAEIRDRTRIEEVVGEYVALRRAGAGSLKGLCPFHDEKTPSFTGRPTHNSFHCFGCAEGGGVIDFVMKMEHRHLVAVLRSEAAARALRARLETKGIGTHAYQLFYAQNDYRQVISVVGKDIFRVRALLGKVPVEDVGDARPEF